jgi:hypothetical protein
VNNTWLILALAALTVAHAVLSGRLVVDDPAYAARVLAETILTLAVPGVLAGLLLWYVAPVVNRRARIPGWRWFALAATAVLALVLQAVA